MVLENYWVGMRAGEVAALKFGDFVVDGAVMDEIRLGSMQA
jgi:hypothetical protein